MGRKERAAAILWIVFAIVVWNVIFDRVIVVSGRAYVQAALDAAEAGGPYARVTDWMVPATGRGLWLATTAAAAVVVVGLVGVRFARRRARADRA